MSENKVYTAIGLMSGTSLDGEIDAALLRTDGHDFVEVLGFKPFPYDQSVRDKVRACFGKRERDAQTDEAEALVTDLHVKAVKASGFEADIIGFHGQTITHAPEDGFTWQLGDGARLAQETGVDVVYDMRQNDMREGGQGAPLIPLYHKAISAKLEKPVAVLNLGGVANVTYIDGDTILAFDTGPANALIDDYLDGMDQDGILAAAGQVDDKAVQGFLNDEYFSANPPKSLDRNHFAKILSSLPKAKTDAVATLTAMTVASVCEARHHFPSPPEEWIVCGGGRKNKTMMKGLQNALNVPVRALEDIGYNGNATEAEGFGYLAVRALLGLPLTLPTTTGVGAPITGGILVKAK